MLHVLKVSIPVSFVLIKCHNLNVRILFFQRYSTATETWERTKEQHQSILASQRRLRSHHINVYSN